MALRVRILTSATLACCAISMGALTLAQSLGLDCPIIATVAALVEGSLAVREAVEQLYNRPLRRE